MTATCRNARTASWWMRLRRRLPVLGPGLITGASDDDPSGIATYSQAGAQYGSQMLWAILLTLPLMAAVQEISARIGQVTGRGIAGNMREHYSRVLVWGIVPLIVVVNVINIGADIGAMGAAMELLVGRNRWHVFPLLFGASSLIAEILLPYRAYSRVLRWLCLAVVSYIGVAFTIDIPWRSVLHDTVVPTLSLNRDYLLTLVAVLGTTISPYLFIWQSSQEVEEQLSAGKRPLRETPRRARAQFLRIRWDTAIGMVLSNGVAYFIILTAALTLHAHGVTSVQTSADAAEALRPIAGRFAFLLFSLGIIGTGLLAVPVLAGSAAYAVAESMRWPIGLDQTPRTAKGFYAILGVSTLLGMALNFASIDPIQALYWSAVLNGLVAVPILIVMMRMASNKEIMGKLAIPRLLRWSGWMTTAAMTAAAVALVVFSMR